MPDRGHPNRAVDAALRSARSPRTSRRALLTAADERHLAKAIEDGREAQRRLDAGMGLDGDHERTVEGERARVHFIEANLRLVQSIANKSSLPAHLDREDLVQDGMIGLDKAVQKFDWRRGYKFSTYATWWIRQSIQRGLEASATTIRIPGQRTRELRSALAENAITGARLGAEHARIDMLSQPESMDRRIGDGFDTIGTLVASEDEATDDAVLRRLAREQIATLLDCLDDTSAFAIVARYGLSGQEPATYGAIGDELGITAQAARRRVERAISKLRGQAEPVAA